MSLLCLLSLSFVSQEIKPIYSYSPPCNFGYERELHRHGVVGTVAHTQGDQREPDQRELDCHKGSSHERAVGPLRDASLEVGISGEAVFSQWWDLGLVDDLVVDAWWVAVGDRREARREK